mmetsp:Transcript_34004/g.39636  ORF Transcript_34004/g.39636 Transcript_34004/m.39636 type:complete len:232 (-) Transcript_34004:136-831(-)
MSRIPSSVQPLLKRSLLVDPFLSSLSSELLMEVANLLTSPIQTTTSPSPFQDSLLEKTSRLAQLKATKLEDITLSSLSSRLPLEQLSSMLNSCWLALTTTLPFQRSLSFLLATTTLFLSSLTTLSTQPRPLLSKTLLLITHTPSILSQSMSMATIIQLLLLTSLSVYSIQTVTPLFLPKLYQPLESSKFHSNLSWSANTPSRPREPTLLSQLLQALLMLATPNQLLIQMPI